MAVFEDTQPWDKKIALYSHTIKWQNGTPVPEKAEPSYIAVEAKEPLREECRHFLHCIEKRETPLTDGNEGYRVLAVLQQAQHALEQRPDGDKKSLSTQPERPYFAHESAFIDAPCRIGPGTKIWHGANITNPRSQIVRHSLYERTLIKRGATIGANATIVCGVTIGRYAFIAAGAVVAKDVPDYALMVGMPARRQGWMSRHGIRLSEPDVEGIMVCPESGFRYKELSAGVLRCLDLDEEKSLPAEMAVGTVSYDHFKRRMSNDQPISM